MSILDKIQVGSTTYDLQDSKATADIVDLKSALTASIQTQTIAPADVAVTEYGQAGAPCKSVVVDIVPIQGGSGDPSPTNVRPISGHTSISVARTGKNLLSDNFSAYSASNSYLYLNNVVPEGQTARFTFVDKDTTVDISSVDIGFQIGLGNGTSPSAYRWVMAGGEIKSNVSNIATNGTVCTGVFIYPKTEATFNALFARYNVMVELGSTATTYEPYAGDTFTTAIPTPPGTVYGGTLDMVSGVLTVDRAMVDLGTLTWFYSDLQNFFNADLSDMKSSTRNVVCSAYRLKGASTGWANMQDGEFGTVNTSIRFHNSAYTSSADFKTAMSGVQLCYELATPITYQCDPQTIAALAGTNVLTSGAGQVSVVIPIDLKEYIDDRIRATRSIIAGVEASMTATKAYSTGDLLIVGDTLYKATTSIANGATLTPGTNVTATTVAEQLILLANA